MRLKLKQMQYLAKQIAFNVEKTGKQYSFWGDYSCNVAVCNNLAGVLDEIAHKFTKLVNKKLVLVVISGDYYSVFFRGKSYTTSSKSDFYYYLMNNGIFLLQYYRDSISEGKNHKIILYKKIGT